MSGLGWWCVPSDVDMQETMYGLRVDATIRMTQAVREVLTLLLESPSDKVYGYLIMDRLGFSSAKTYRILARLTDANWLVRDESGAISNAGKPRVTYSIAPAAMTTIVEAMADASERERRGSQFRAHGPYLAPPGD